MSVSNRFTHPFERWMNNIVRRELDAWRRPSGFKKGSSKALSKGANEIQSERSMMPWAGKYMDPWQNLPEPFLLAEAPNVADMDFFWPSFSSDSHINDEGKLVLNMQMPKGIEADDIHLDFEEGCLKLHATKSHEENRKLHGSKGKSMHKSHVSVSHFWPLDKSIAEKDIQANFNAEDSSLEVVVDQPHQIGFDRTKSTPIAIGGSKSHKHQSLDQEKTSKDIIGDKSSHQDTFKYDEASSAERKESGYKASESYKHDDAAATSTTTSNPRQSDTWKPSPSFTPTGKHTEDGERVERGDWPSSTPRTSTSTYSDKGERSERSNWSSSTPFVSTSEKSERDRPSTSYTATSTPTSASKTSTSTSGSQDDSMINLSGAKDAATEAAKAAGSKAKEWVGDAKDATVEAAKSAGSKAQDVGQKVKETATETAKNWGSKAKEIASDASEAAKSAASNLTGTAKAAAEKAEKAASSKTKKNDNPLDGPQVPSIDEM
jgi:HSP20 family molecular chaperone IbpA